MASATSKVSVVTTGTSVRNRRKNYYVTDVTTLADGSIQRQTYRSDAQGNNKQLVQTVKTDSSGKIVSDVVSSGASAQEKKSLANPDSTLRKSIRDQTKDAGEAALANEEQAAAGGLTAVGKKNLDVVAGGSGNKANNAENDGTQQSPAPPTSGKGYSSDTRTDYNGGESLRYPSSLGTENQDQDFLKIQMVKYEPRGLSFQGTGGIPSRSGLTSKGKAPDGRDILSTIFLPIPSGIQDQNQVGWNKDEADPVKLAMADFAKSTITQGVSGASDSLSKTADTLKNNPGIKEAIASQLTRNLTGVNVLGRTEGVVINSNIELLFDGPSLRTFSFNFKFAPRDKDEAKEVQKIIRTLKQGMSAKKAADFLFIKSPHTFFLGYYKGAELQPFMNKFKECALTNLSVQYAPDGPFATFTDGSMTSYGVSMTFQELEPVFDNDYGEDYDNIGF